MDRQQLKLLGEHLGYPKCCIDSFWQTMGAVNNPKGAQAGNHTGFIPCPICADKVLNNTVKLEELITNRIHEIAFPYMDRSKLPNNLKY